MAEIAIEKMAEAANEEAKSANEPSAEAITEEMPVTSSRSVEAAEQAEGAESEAAEQAEGAESEAAEHAEGAESEAAEHAEGAESEATEHAEGVESEAPDHAEGETKSTSKAPEKDVTAPSEPSIAAPVETSVTATEERTEAVTDPAPTQAAEPDPTAVIALIVAVLIALFFAYALRKQRRRRREEMGEVEEAAGEASAAPVPETDIPPSLEPGAVEPSPFEHMDAPAAPDTTAPAEETEKERRRREFLEQQRATRQAREKEKAERLAAKGAAEKEAAERAAMEAERQRAEAEARREALLASSGPLTERLSKTRGGFVGRLSSLLGKKIDEDTLEEIEEVLFTADIGVQTAGELLETVRDSLKKNDLSDRSLVLDALKKHVTESLGKNGVVAGKEALDPDACDKRPYVIMVIGVNGVGKTTTIGKLAGRYIANGKKVILAAGDTFRAAAVEQLEIWGDRVGCEVVKGTEGADPGSVTFDAVKKGISEETDVVIVDTAGRLHTKVPLMEELAKVHRVLGKAREEAPDEVLLVVDATTGQNALQQARLFREAVPVTSIALTKLDGTAKGGVVIGISGELNLPVRYIGVGEKVGDLRPFDAEEFVEALFG